MITRKRSLGLSLILMMTAGASIVSGQAVRWDIQSVVFGTTTVSFNAGGSATAIASFVSSITLTGSGRSA